MSAGLRRAVVVLGAAALVAGAVLAWRENWFGLPLSDARIGRFLAPEAGPRRQRIALRQLTGRISPDSGAARRWYPRVIALSQSASSEVRLAAAAAMGLDPSSAEFRRTLGELLEDGSPPVRYAAAASLAAAGDSRARPELRAMLRSYTVYSPYSGSLELRVKEGARLQAGSVLARVDRREIPSPIAGTAGRLYEPAGAEIRIGQRIAEIAPSERQLLDALDALARVGDPFDIAAVRRLTAPDVPSRVRQRAASTLARLEAIRPPEPPPQ